MITRSELDVALEEPGLEIVCDLGTRELVVIDLRLLAAAEDPADRLRLLLAVQQAEG
jgi:hypothetical protein